MPETGRQNARRTNSAGNRGDRRHGRTSRVLNLRSPMAEDIEVILKLERLAGLPCLPQTAREVILSFVDMRVRQAMERVAERRQRRGAAVGSVPGTRFATICGPTTTGSERELIPGARRVDSCAAGKT